MYLHCNETLEDRTDNMKIVKTEKTFLRQCQDYPYSKQFTTLGAKRQ